MRLFWILIWNISEFTGIGLGKFAPFVFQKMIGARGMEIDSLGNEIRKDKNDQP